MLIKSKKKYFLTILGSQEPRPNFPKIPLDGVMLALGPQDPPKSPQDPPDSLPRPPQTPSKTDFLVILDPNLVDFRRQDDLKMAPNYIYIYIY